jgi:hypothetical protein
MRHGVIDRVGKNGEGRVNELRRSASGDLDDAQAAATGVKRRDKRDRVNQWYARTLTLGLGARGQRAGHPPRFNELLRARALRGSQKRSCQTTRSNSEAEKCPEPRAAERESVGMGGSGDQVRGLKRAGRA